MSDSETPGSPLCSQPWPVFDPSRTGYFGIDVGGSLCKICFYEPRNDERVRRIIEFLSHDETYGASPTNE